MHRRFHLAAIGRVAASAGRIIGAMDFNHVARCILHHALRGDEVGIAQAHFFARRKAVVLGRRNFAEVVLLDVDLAREWHLARSGDGSSGLLATSTNSS